MSSSVVKIPQPDEITQREKDDAMGAYFMMFAAWGVGLPLPVLGLIAAFIYFMINKKNSRFVAFHSLQSLLSQLPVTAINLALIVWLIRNIFLSLNVANAFNSAFFVYLFFSILANILYIVISIVALVKARKGQFFYMPFFGRSAFARYYGPNAVPLTKPAEPNKPPEGF